MRIISPFKDYYDGVLAHDRESEPLYVRTPKKIDLGCSSRTGTYYGYDLDLIGFCGRVYPVVRPIVWNGTERFSAVCYSLNNVDQFMEKTLCRRDLEAFRKGTWRAKRQLRWTTVRHEYGKLFERYKMNQDIWRHIFEELRCPVFVDRDEGDDRVRTLNAPLRELEFYRIFDTYRAYQELRMWLSNQAAPEKPIPTVSDEDLRDAKGFDNHSFKKEPTKKRK